jgi:hypothetical protein
VAQVEIDLAGISSADYARTMVTTAQNSYRSKNQVMLSSTRQSSIRSGNSLPRTVKGIKVRDYKKKNDKLKALELIQKMDEKHMAELVALMTALKAKNSSNFDIAATNLK